METNEQWKPIPGFTGYDVSDHGRVRSYRKRGAGNCVAWEIAEEPQRILKPCHSGGYPFVALMDDESNRQTVRVHSLVLLAFVGPCPEGLEVCHNDDDRANNHLGNLRYDTHKANVREASANGRRSFHPDDVLAIRRQGADGQSHVELAREYGVSASAIGGICRGELYPAVPGPRSNGRGNARLTAAEVGCIKAALAQGVTQRDLADQYGVHESTISNIYTGRTWKHVKAAELGY